MALDLLKMNTLGRSERLDSSHPQHLQRPARVSYPLAHLCYYGRPNVCWQILQGIISIFTLSLQLQIE